ncbi:MAG TPA: hypothetical protein VK501_05505 [Baekduia sp.]|uniref:hypothetical protein n=1 Tax=Baekduia sp. TaxID=2600305 RepID=UPI002CC67A0F|nr:hypothetical protein [Baekduia sp.]HMJ33353.1 hypothetical protein [Baekduia sp.]
MRSSPPLVLAAVLAALLPASALAAPGRWSSPVTITPNGGPQLSATAEAFVTPQGRSLVLTSDGATPLLSVGDASGAFATPTPVGSGTDGLTQFDGAVGPDGSFAVAWAAGGVGHVAIAPPGGSPGPTVDLPDANVTAIAVAIGANGATTVAYRSKSAPPVNIYTVSAATAPAGSSTFAEPRTVDNTRTGIDGVDVALAPNGDVAVTYRKLAPSYKTYAAVYHPGADNFEPVQAVSPYDNGDVGPRIAAGSDGSFVVAWGNGVAGPAYAVRAAGAGAFGPAQPLYPAGGDVSSFVDLAPTPTGGAAAAWAGSGVIRAAVAPTGGTFGTPVDVDTYGGDVVAQAAVTVAPDQTLTVVANHPSDGTIEATDVGGAAQVIGYGAAGTLSPVAVASSADRTVATWRDAAGGISAATRSPVAPPAPIGPGPKPGPTDTTAPKVSRVTKSTRVRFHKIPKTLSVKLQCNEACVMTATGRLAFTVAGKKKPLSLPIHPYTGSRTPSAKARTVTLRLGTKARIQLGKSAKSGRGATAYLVVTASDAAGNVTRYKLQMTMKRAAK